MLGYRLIIYSKQTENIVQIFKEILLIKWKNKFFMYKINNIRLIN